MKKPVLKKGRGMPKGMKGGYGKAKKGGKKAK